MAGLTGGIGLGEKREENGGGRRRKRRRCNGDSDDGLTIMDGVGRRTEGEGRRGGGGGWQVDQGTAQTRVREEKRRADFGGVLVSDRVWSS